MTRTCKGCGGQEYLLFTSWVCDVCRPVGGKASTTKPRRRDIRLGDRVRLIPNSKVHEIFVAGYYPLIRTWLSGATVMFKSLVDEMNKPEYFDSWEIIGSVFD